MSQLEGEPCRIFRQVVDSETLSIEVVGVVPRLDARLDVDVEVAFLPLAPSLELTPADLLVRGRVRRWQPGALEPGEPTDVDGLGFGSGPRSFDLAVELVRWVPRELEPSEQVLLRKAVADRLRPVRLRVEPITVQVKPADFGRAAALKRAGLDAADQAVRVDQTTWALEAGGRVLCVPETGDVVSAPGSIGGRLLVQLGRDDAITLRFPPDTPAEVLATVVTGKPLSDKPGNLLVRVTPARFGAALKAIVAIKHSLRGADLLPE